MKLKSKKIWKIVVKKKKEENKKYSLVKEPNNQIVSIIPFYWYRPKINSYKKEFYLLETSFILNSKLNDLINIEIRNKLDEETVLDYKKYIKKEIVSYFKEEYDYDLSMKNIINILDICLGNIRIYLINLNKNEDDIEVFQGLDNTVKFLSFYNEPEIEEESELFQNILELEHNSYVLNKKFNLIENENKILDIKLKTIINKIMLNYIN